MLDTILNFPFSRFQKGNSYHLNYGRSLEDSGTVYHAFPEPEALLGAGRKGLQSIKLSRRKSQYILDIAAALVSGETDLENLRNLADEAVIRQATAIRGVGQWTAHWLLIRALSRPDIFPHGDLALRRTVGRLLNEDQFSRRDLRKMSKGETLQSDLRQ